MTAPLPDVRAPGASMSSSGFVDGLGRRVLAFDREEGVTLERLIVRPELAAFEPLLRDRVDRVATLEDERIARPRTLDRAADGSLVIVSEFVPGSRLSDLLDLAADRGIAPGVDAAFGFLLDVLPALCGLHAGAGFAHGTIAPARTVVTPAGQVVLLDAVFGGALAHLRYGARTLWRTFGIAVRPAPGAARLDTDTDIAQAALAAVRLVLGRPLSDEYPDRIRALIEEVVEVAQIRGTSALARGVEGFFERALPLRGGRPFAAADDALIELRDLAGELGLHMCRRALVDFVSQLEGVAAPALPAELDLEEVGTLLGGLRAVEAAQHAAAQPDPEPDAIEARFAAGPGAEVDLQVLTDDEDDDAFDVEAVTEIEVISESGSPDDAAVSGWLNSRDDQPAPGEDRGDWWEEPVAPAAPPRSYTSEAHHEPPAAPVPGAPPPVAVAAREAAAAPPVLAAPPQEPAMDPAHAAQARAPEPAVNRPADVPNETPAAPPPAEGAPSGSAVRQRRAKRARPSRARKDRLRSAAAPVPLAGTLQPEVPTEPEPDPAPVTKASEAPPNETWLVRPGRAAAFEPPVVPPPIAPPPVGTPPPVPPPLAVAPPSASIPVAAAPPALPVYSPPPEPVRPAFPGPPVPAPPLPASSGFGQPGMWTPPQAPPPALSAPRLAVPSGPIRLKATPPRSRGSLAPPVVDIYAMPAAVPPPPPKSMFPWKLATALLVLVGAAVVGGHRYLPARSAADTAADDGAPAQAGAAPSDNSATSRMGRLEVRTQPAGARILLDGRPVGQSPLTLNDVRVGRRTITIVSSSGTLERTVRVEGGRTATIDVPVFSGWINVSAPFVVEVSAGGRVIGTTEEPRIMLSPGRHTLTLANRSLGYRSSHVVDIEPGEVRPIVIDPRGRANLNAAPWAEVWVDGQKVGETPLANVALPIGTRDVVFKHPELGDRRMTVTIRGDRPAVVSVDMRTP